MFRTSFAIHVNLVVVLATLPFPHSSAQPAKPKGTNYAFLVACAGYDPDELKPIKDDVTINDILEFKKALLETDFENGNIVVMHDRQSDRRLISEHDKIVEKLDLFLAKMRPEDTVVLALSGHGVLFAGEKSGYFCPVDAKVSTKSKLIPMEGPKSIFERLEKCQAGTKLLIANACRNDPRSAVSEAGDPIKLADDYPEVVPKGIAAIYSCAAGQKSYFDPERKRSVFFVHLTEAWRGKYQTAAGPLTVEAVFDQTHTKTKNDHYLTKHNYQQFPGIQRKYEGQWVIARDWASFKEPKAGEERDFEISPGVKMKFCWIPAGEAQLGSPQAERDEVMKQLIQFKKVLSVDKEPLWLSAEAENKRGVFRTKGFWMGKYTVTQAEWESIMGINPSYFQLEKGQEFQRGWGKTKLESDGIRDTSRYPVESVSWNDCLLFLDKLNTRSGSTNVFTRPGRFVLPLADEWEYACRAGLGNKRAYYWGNESNGNQANCAGDRPFGTETIGKKLGRTCSVDDTNGGMYAKHPWGLCHMLGNVSQLCGDKPKVERPIARSAIGGAFFNLAYDCRSASRNSIVAPDVSGSGCGLRICYRPE
jgi:sulfatase modifying factor 1